MEKEKAKKRLAKLRQEIDYHRYQYHVLDKETISASALDSLKKELSQLEEKFPDLITPDSPSQRVAGEPLAKFKKIKHDRPMTSLNDVFSEEELRDWETRNRKILEKEGIKLDSFDYYGELKLDGLAVSLVYEQGLFKYGATRGNGLVGEDISHNLKTINSLPLRLKELNKSDLARFNLSQIEVEKIISITRQKKVEVRGEVIMPLSVLRKINNENRAKGLPLLANSRNGAAGSLRQLDSKVAKQRSLDFYAYDLFLNDLAIGEIIKSRADLEKLSALLGFKVVIGNRLLPGLSAVKEFYDKSLEKRDNLDFQIDGTVIKINLFKYWSKLGIVGKAPRYMIAYKFPAKQATTKIEEVVWQVGRTGVLTPIAILEPVEVDGVKVAKASLHNFDEINRLDLKIGDTVIIERAGDVIPKVIKVLPGLRNGREKSIPAPKICPRCGGLVKREKEMAAYRCLNKDCQEMIVRRLIHFVSRPALDINGLGKKIVILLYNQGLLKNIVDFYRLKKEDLLALPGFKEKKVNNIISAIEKKREIDLDRFIFSLGIPQVGEISANLLANTFKSEKGGMLRKVSPLELLKWAKDKDKNDWQELKDIGEIVAQALFDFWHSQEAREIILGLKAENISLILTENKSGYLSKKKFVLTGSLSSLTRSQAKDKIKAVGGEVSGNISQDIDYLVLGKDPGSKYSKAKEMGIKIISEKEFLEILNNN